MGCCFQGSSLTAYHGVGFSFNVPETWIEEIPSAFEDTTLVKFAAPDHARHGEPVAEADVLCLSSIPGTSSLTDPMAFLKTNWESIFPELQGDSQPLDVAEQVERSVSCGSETSLPTHGSSPPPSKAFAALSPPSGASLALPVSPSDSCEPVFLKARSRSLRESPSTPAFVVWAEELLVGDDTVFRFEVVFHPADLGDRRGEIRHCLLSIAGSGSTIHVCRVTGTESFFFEQRSLMKSIVDSFSLRNAS